MSRLRWLAITIFVAGVFSFVLVNTVKAETYYRNATWQCQDGTTTRQGSSTTCKSSSEWNTVAETACARLCNRSGKCGVAQFSVSTECRLTEVVAPTAPVVTPVVRPVVVTPVVVTPVVRYDASAKSTFMAPADGAVLTNYPRTAELQWTPITSASKYEIGLYVVCDGCVSPWVNVDNLTSDNVYVVT